ncbi:hypothetical protein SAMN05444006_12512 [Allgaiera indica]|uniref:Oxidoreductase molybdopterin-binding domain-containing protein n=2 Tax=Allgaiera indica TaxID=765699 RepID=A0A1H3DTL7_9RHOB|nr:hypothetical protein SAMN05444006_12512 [Allgaiera indica]
MFAIIRELAVVRYRKDCVVLSSSRQPARRLEWGRPRPRGSSSCGRAGAWLALLWLTASLMSVPAWAVASPRGVVLLTVKRAIPGQGTPSVKRFDMAMLQALPHRSFTTTTIWTKGPQRFEGVLLRDLMRALGAPPGAMLLAHAQNAYSARIPLSSATDPGPIIAYLRNGKPMSLREKGPLWLVFPYDADRRWQTEVVYSRSIWQLDQITIAPGPAAD